MDKQRIVFRHDLHIALWNWLSQNPAKNKENWPRWKGMGKVRYHSFACDAAHKMGVAMLGRDHPNPCMTASPLFSYSWQSSITKPPQAVDKGVSRIILAIFIRVSELPLEPYQACCQLRGSRQVPPIKWRGQIMHGFG